MFSVKINYINILWPIPEHLSANILNTHSCTVFRAHSLWMYERTCQLKRWRERVVTVMQMKWCDGSVCVTEEESVWTRVGGDVRFQSARTQNQHLWDSRCRLLSQKDQKKRAASSGPNSWALFRHISNSNPFFVNYTAKTHNVYSQNLMFTNPIHLVISWWTWGKAIFSIFHHPFPHWQLLSVVI